LAKNIKLKIVATPDDWIRLADKFYQLPEALGIGIEYHFILPVLNRMLPRGKGKGIPNRLAVFLLKREASYLYVFLSYWCKKPFQDWPDCLKRLINKAKSDDYEYFIRGKKGYIALAITGYCLEQTWGKIPGWKKRCSTENMDSLYQTYIYDKGRLKDIKSELLTDPTLRDKDFPAKNPILSSIFKRLKVI